MTDKRTLIIDEKSYTIEMIDKGYSGAIDSVLISPV